jgi:SAM-dependent methyltransferase
MKIFTKIGYYIQSIVFAKTTNKMWLRLLIILAIVLLAVMYFRKYSESVTKEGFTQQERFVLKSGDAKYDTMYAELYDDLMLPQDRMDEEVSAIVEMTQPSADKSVFLDVGSGTGHLVNCLQQKGYQIYGIEKSPAMVSKCEKSFPNADVKCGNVADPMSFEHNTFSHILCTHYTIYHFENKKTFFHNCYSWLIPYGYLVLHLVDKDHFDTIVPAGKPEIDGVRDYLEKRITSTGIDFGDYYYKANYDFSLSNTTEVVFKESFTNKSNGVVRQNEETLYMDSIDTVLKVAQQCGFVLKGKSEYSGDKYQYLYVLERV